MIAATLDPQKLIVVGGATFLAAAVGLLAGIDPALGLSVALALVATSVVLLNLYAGLILFILVISVTEVPGLVGGDLTVSKLAGGLLAVSWLAHLTLRKEGRTDFFPSTHPFAAWALVLFLSWLGASQLWATDTAASMEALFRLSLNVILFLIIFTAVRTRAQAIGVVAAFVAGACLDAGVGLLTEGAIGQGRLSGTSEPGQLAAALVAGLALSLGLARPLRPWPLARLAVQGAAMLCVATIFLTGSRGGLIALAVALAAFIAVGGHWRGRLLVLSLVVAIAGFSFFNYAASPELRERVTTVGSGSGRVDLWTVGWRMVEDKPINGVGFGNFSDASARYVLEPGDVARGQYVIDDAKLAHNTYLEFWAETGIVGVATFLLIVGFCLWTALRAAREFAIRGDNSFELLARATFVAMAGVLAGAFFASNQFQKDLWIVLALGPALLSVAVAEGAATRRDSAAWSASRAGP